jgi:hypothetical protein
MEQLVVVPLMTIVLSFSLLAFFSSREEKELEFINYQWKDITLWMLIMLFLIGVMFAAVTISMVAGLKSIRVTTEYLLNLLIFVALLIMFYRLVIKLKLGSFTMMPNKEVGMYTAYILVYWVFLFHLEELGASSLLAYKWFWILTGGLILAAAAGIIVTSYLLYVYRKVMLETGLAFPIDLIPLHRAVLVFFILVSGTSLSGIAGLIFTHIMMDIAAAIIILINLVHYTVQVKAYIE